MAQNPSQSQSLQFVELRTSIKVAVIAIMNNGRRPRSDVGFVLEIADKVVKETEAVFGNRGSGYSVTWDDERLCLLATLKNAVELLEKTHDEEL